MRLLLLCFFLCLFACGTTQQATSDTATRTAEPATFGRNGRVIEVGGALNLADLLVQVPGVFVNGNRVSIRGMGAPLYIIDEVQIGRSYAQANNAVNIFDIDRVEVLKNAADLAIYGRRGQNGVIKIYTRRG